MRRGPPTVEDPPIQPLKRRDFLRPIDASALELDVGSCLETPDLLAVAVPYLLSLSGARTMTSSLQ